MMYSTYATRVDDKAVCLGEQLLEALRECWQVCQRSKHADCRCFKDSQNTFRQSSRRTDDIAIFHWASCCSYCGVYDNDDDEEEEKKEDGNDEEKVLSDKLCNLSQIKKMEFYRLTRYRLYYKKIHQHTHTQTHQHTNRFPLPRKSHKRTDKQTDAISMT